jgi:hypothetical protein
VSEIPVTEKTNSTSGSDEPKERIAIIGGGIAGLLCAYVLSKDNHTVELFESSDVLGGRIRSFRFSDKLLNKLERQDDKTRKPIKNEAVLEKAFIPEMLMPDTAKIIASQQVPQYIPQPDTPLVWKPDPELGEELTDAQKELLASVQLYRNFKTEDYDKRLWDHLEFNAEFGPMRIELEVQRMLDILLKHLHIKRLNGQPPSKVGRPYDLVRMERFPPFSSPGSVGDPVYDLMPEEAGKNPLELLKLGVCRAVVDLHFDPAKPPLLKADAVEKEKVKDFEGSLKILIEKLNNASATQRPSGPVFESWVRNHLHEDDYWVIQRYGEIPVLYAEEKYIPLHTMGFWNLIAAYLSHNAVGKVRDLGAFYHLIPENPNAGEWLAWWLRQISISSHLEGIFGGMQSVIEKLVIAMGVERDAQNPLHMTNGSNLRIHLNTTVTALTKKGSWIDVTAVTKENSQGAVTSTRHPKSTGDPFHRAIMALPTVPAEKLTQNSNLWSEDDPDPENKKRFTDYLHSALPFQLVKVFFIVRERWWEENVRANPDVTRYPTREVYFWKSRNRDSRRGLIMLYTDRPAATFWANYVPDPIQEDIDELCRLKPSDEVDTVRARIKNRFVEYVNENEGQKITPDDIIWCGIMDWGREPYGAASHTWRPNREYWNTLAELADWPIKSADGAEVRLHVCGEAYSDYHAFIEGSLRSAVHILTQIRGKNETKEERLFKILEDRLEATLERSAIEDAITRDAAIKKAAEQNEKALKEAAEQEEKDTKAKAATEPAQDDATPPNNEPTTSDKDNEEKNKKIELEDDNKYVKDFYDFSNELDEIARRLRHPESQPPA